MSVLEYGLPGTGKARIEKETQQMPTGVKKRIKKKMLKRFDARFFKNYVCLGFGKRVLSKRRTFKGKTICSTRTCLLDKVSKDFNEFVSEMGIDAIKNSKIFLVEKRVQKI